MDEAPFDRDMTDLKTIEIIASLNTGLTAEDLLSMTLAFGYVSSVQKIVERGFIRGLVTYSNADEAAMATMELNSTKDVFVDLLQSREARKERSASRSDQPSYLPQDRFSDMPPQRLSCLDTPCPPYHSQSVTLHIHNLPNCVEQKRWMLSLLPTYATNVKVMRRSAIATLPNFSTASWLMDDLRDLFAGNKHLHFSLENQGGGCPGMKASHRQPLQQHRRPQRLL
ncbi:uncharacterized protein [Pempheris klunzingeri]|uniref:uncharacterized protein n=1 Tax=Pempheris klunzingeri TaxID=3127111 RepID=UPI00397EAC1C